MHLYPQLRAAASFCPVTDLSGEQLNSVASLTVAEAHVGDVLISDP